MPDPAPVLALKNLLILGPDLVTERTGNRLQPGARGFESLLGLQGPVA